MAENNSKNVEAVIDLSEQLESMRQSHYMPGALAIAVKDGQVVEQGRAGFRRQGDPTPIRINDTISLVTSTEWITATLVARLVEQGLLSWTVRVSDCFPNVTRFQLAYQNATLEQFLSHRAGAPRTTPLEARFRIPLESMQEKTIRQMRFWVAETIMKEPLGTAPGTFLKSHAGHTVAIAMIEKITNQDWEELMKNHIIKPLNLTSMMIGVPYDDNLPPRAPVAHTLLAEKTDPIPNPLLSESTYRVGQAISGASTYIACNLQDWLKFMRTVLMSNKNGFLNDESLRKLTHPVVEESGYKIGIGFGFTAMYEDSPSKPPRISISGSAFGHYITSIIYPNIDFMIVFYTNCISETFYPSVFAQRTISDFYKHYMNSTTVSNA